MTDKQFMDEQILLLRDLIEKRTGLFFRDYGGLEFLAARLTPLAEKSGCPTLSEYHRLLGDAETAGSGEWSDLIATLSKPISGFLRHKKKTRFLIDNILPALRRGGGRNSLKIWSAGCASGEEALMIAMALDGCEWPNEADEIEIKIYASDVNVDAIAKARAGIYPEEKVRDLPTEFRDKYFSREDQGWRVNSEIHDKIEWSPANLVNENEIAELASSDIIFCRNVFIYFSESSIRQTLDIFGKYMPDGGYLLGDSGEYFTALIEQTGMFQPQEKGQGFVWMRKD